MNSNTSFLLSCTLIEATPADVPRAFQNLSRDMPPEVTPIFLDKLERYAQKPDRALFLIEYRESIIAFATIIQEAPVPETLLPHQKKELVDYSCGTGLMVLPEHRRKRVATILVRAWESWTKELKISGTWLVTHKMSNWYQNQFDFSLLGSIHRKGVKKTILCKKVFSRTSTAEDLNSIY